MKPKREFENPGVAWEPMPGVPRFVIPAKAGIQPGFRLALRLAGMTKIAANPQPVPTR